MTPEALNMKMDNSYPREARMTPELPPDWEPVGFVVCPRCQKRTQEGDVHTCSPQSFICMDMDDGFICNLAPNHEGDHKAIARECIDGKSYIARQWERQ